jgi:hypothetical protein
VEEGGFLTDCRGQTGQGTGPGIHCQPDACLKAATASVQMVGHVFPTAPEYGACHCCIAAHPQRVEWVRPAVARLDLEVKLRSSCTLRGGGRDVVARAVGATKMLPQVVHMTASNVSTRKARKTEAAGSSRRRRAFGASATRDRGV